MTDLVPCYEFICWVMFTELQGRGDEDEETRKPGDNELANGEIESPETGSEPSNQRDAHTSGSDSIDSNSCVSRLFSLARSTRTAYSRTLQTRCVVWPDILTPDWRAGEWFLLHTWLHQLLKADSWKEFHLLLLYTIEFLLFSYYEPLTGLHTHIPKDKKKKLVRQTD